MNDQNSSTKRESGGKLPYRPPQPPYGYGTPPRGHPSTEESRTTTSFPQQSPEYSNYGQAGGNSNYNPYHTPHRPTFPTSPPADITPNRQWNNRHHTGNIGLPSPVSPVSVSQPDLTSLPPQFYMNPNVAASPNIAFDLNNPAASQDFLNHILERPRSVRTPQYPQSIVPQVSRTYAKINSDRTTTEQDLYPDYKVRPKPRKFFTQGKVFLTLWSEPASASNASNPSAYSEMPQQNEVAPGKFNQTVFSKIRRFVVVGEGTESCFAVPINTYSGQGAGRRGSRKGEHAIVHTTVIAPSPLPSEHPTRGEPPLLATPIRVIPDIRTEKLDERSRIDFGKVYTIEHNVKVKAFGEVHPHSKAAMEGQFRLVWESAIKPRKASTSSRPTSAQLDPVPEHPEGSAAAAPEGPSAADWVHAYGLLTASGFTAQQAMSLLREMPSTNTGSGSTSATQSPP